MTAHLHAEFVEGCYRCDLSRDEIDPPRCAYCGQPDGFWNRHLVLNPPGHMGPMHKECMADIARWGCD